MCFSEREVAVRRLEEVVERAEQEYHVGRAVRLVPSSSVTDGRVHATVGRLLDMQRDRIDEVDLVAELHQPSGVHPRAATDVQDAQAAVRQVTGDEFLRSLEFQRARREASEQPVGFSPAVVEGSDVWVERHAAPPAHRCGRGCGPCEGRSWRRQRTLSTSYPHPRKKA